MLAYIVFHHTICHLYYEIIIIGELLQLINQRH